MFGSPSDLSIDKAANDTYTWTYRLVELLRSTISSRRSRMEDKMWGRSRNKEKTWWRNIMEDKMWGRSRNKEKTWWRNIIKIEEDGPVICARFRTKTI
jgi:hypothetical protein